MLHEIELHINQKIYTGWQSLRIHRSLHNLCGHFSIAYTPSDNEQTLPIQPNDSCVIYCDHQKLLTGFIDSLDRAVDATDYQVHIQGRDKTADVVDCSAPSDLGELNNLTLDKIAQKLTRPYGIKVISDCTLNKPMDTFSLQIGETVFSALERACRSQAVLLQTNPEGDVVLTRVNQQRATLQLHQGNNILSARIHHDVSQRYRSYQVHSQGNDFDNTLNAYGNAQDLSIPRHRELTILAENTSDNRDAKARAHWEAVTRLAKSLTLTLTTPNFGSDDTLWQINQLVHVNLPLFAINDDFLITETTYQLNQHGMTTELTLTDKAAFQPLVVKKKNNSLGW